MSEKINLSLFEDFFESSSPADWAKKLINTSPDSRRSTSRRDKRQNIRFKRQNKRNEQRRKKI